MTILVKVVLHYRSYLLLKDMSSLHKGLTAIVELVYLFLAICFLRHPATNLLGLSYLLSFGVLISGLSAWWFYVNLPQQLPRAYGRLSSVVALLAGIYLLFGIFVALPVAIPVILGVWLLVFGGMRLLNAVDMHEVFPNLTKRLVVLVC